MKITITEYAARHNRSPVTVRQKALRGGFKTARRVGRDWLIDEDEPYTDNRPVAADQRPPLRHHQRRGLGKNRQLFILRPDSHRRRRRRLRVLHL